MQEAIAREKEFNPPLDALLYSDEEDNDNDDDPKRDEEDFQSLEPNTAFDLIIGADVLYEYPMAVALPCVIRNRLKRDGTCILVNGTRIQDIFDQFLENCALAGLCARMSMIDIKDDPDIQRFTREGCPAREEGAHSVLTVMHSKK